MPKIVATEEDWLREGLQRFSHGGPDALHVEAMARSLGCAKSSFYWYFKSKAGFLSQVLAFWSRLGTEAVIARLTEEASNAQRFDGLLREALGSRQGGDFLFYLRRLAQRDPDAAALLQRTESTRIAYLASLLARAGLPAPESVVRAEIIYDFYLGWYERNRLREVSDAELTVVIDQLMRSMNLPDDLRLSPTS